ncbi:MAG: hypothetical protein MAG451_00491 [Anaerolineales bacterium]|nr:hypothetical protein [Anaerolineales bacterium]
MSPHILRRYCYGVSVQAASVNGSLVPVAAHDAGQLIRFDGREGSHVILAVSEK